MRKQRIRIVVEVNLDPVPGWGDNPEDFVNAIRQDLNMMFPHYKPTVEFDKIIKDDSREALIQQAIDIAATHHNGPNKIVAIKKLRDLYNEAGYGWLGLKEAKDLIDKAWPREWR